MKKFFLFLVASCAVSVYSMDDSSSGSGLEQQKRSSKRYSFYCSCGLNSQGDLSEHHRCPGLVLEEVEEKDQKRQQKRPSSENGRIMVMEIEEG